MYLISLVPKLLYLLVIVLLCYAEGVRRAGVDKWDLSKVQVHSLPILSCFLRVVYIYCCTSCTYRLTI